jgi:alkylation response protein AidB-like acyl-CoA dehydrogenase
MDWERACIAAMHAGTISRLCDEAAAFVKTRIRAGKSLAEFQAVQFKIADLAVRAETSRLMAIRAAEKVDANNGTLAAAQAKIMASESLFEAATLTATLMGGSGITNENITNVLADAQAAMIYSGPNDVLRELIASQL